jgi:hypothetical protein
MVVVGTGRLTAKRNDEDEEEEIVNIQFVEEPAYCADHHSLYRMFKNTQ